MTLVNIFLYIKLYVKIEMIHNEYIFIIFIMNHSIALNHSIAFNCNLLPDMEKINTEMGRIGLIRSVQVHYVLSNKYTVHVHFHFWYNCPITKTLDYHFNRNEIVYHEEFTYDLRKLYTVKDDLELVELRAENRHIRQECMSVISQLRHINDNIEDIKHVLCRKKVRFESAAEKNEYRIFPKDCSPYVRTKTKCPGCMDNQPNQMAHIGPNGCLGDDY